MLNYMAIVVNFPFLDGTDFGSPFYDVYILQLVHFVRVCSNIEELNNRNKFVTSSLLKKGYQYHKLRKLFF